MDDGDEVDPKVRELAVFIASLVTSGRRVLVHCTEGSTDQASSWLER
jgi:protein-tyrosine phosphatase